MRFVAAAVTVGVMLTGCGAKVDGLVGLQRVGGHVWASVHVCPGHEVDRITLTEAGGAFRDEWAFDDAVTETGSVDLGVLDDAVTLLDTGNSFVLEASSSRSDDLIHGPQFVSADLAALRNGEILTAAGPFDEDGFAQMVASYCG